MTTAAELDELVEICIRAICDVRDKVSSTLEKVESRSWIESQEVCGVFSKAAALLINRSGGCAVSFR